jgi:sulfur carrier protein
MALTLVINGQSRSFPTLDESSTMAQVVVALDLKGDRIAVEHNGTISPRTTWDDQKVSSGDRLEVVHFVGGGGGPDTPRPTIEARAGEGLSSKAF